MLTKGAIAKNLVFVVIAALVLGFIGVRYADLGRVLGLRDYYTVRVDLARTGGLYTHADVTYRGVSVGRVGPIELTDDGVRAQLRINNSAPDIPDDLTAVVADYSAIGEQYIDLRPRSGQGPYLKDGSHIDQAATSTPAPVTNLLSSLDGFAASVDTKNLRTVVDELGNAFAGQGPNLQRLLDTGSDFVHAADSALPDSVALMENGETVLRTQNEEAEALKSFASGAKELSAQLKESDQDLREVIAQGPKAATQVTALLRDVDPSLSVLLANLLTTSDLAVTRQDGLETLLVRLPQAAAAGATSVTPSGARFDMALTFFDPPPCRKGYEGTQYRNGLVTTPPKTVNTAARCTSPASSGILVRGSAHAPRGGVPDAAEPGSGLAADDGSTARSRGAERLPGALGLPGLPSPERTGMAGLLGLEGSE